MGLQPHLHLNLYDSSIKPGAGGRRLSVDTMYAEESSDTDSAYYGDSSDSALSTVSPSLYEHVEENGRTYHAYKSGKYHLPNDEPELDRLDLQHAMFVKLFDNKLALAPIEDKPLHRVLDIATGTGIWAIEFAERFPQASVIGTDLTPVQPSFVPPNCAFEVDDAEDEWIFHHKFEYIHARAVLSCFANPKEVIRKAFSSLAPGGYLEFQDPIMPMSFDVPPPADSAFLKWNALSMQAAQAGGRPWDNVTNYAQWMREVGFVDVEEQRLFLATGPWPDNARDKELGKYQLQNWLKAMEGMSIRNLARIGWSAEECRVLVASCRQELLSGKLRPYNQIMVVWGRKPTK